MEAAPGPERLFDAQRLPAPGLALLALVLYLPVGLCLLVVRLFVGLHVFLVSCALPDGGLRRLVVRAMCGALGLVVRERDAHLRDRRARVYVSNHVTPFDHNMVNLLTRCSTPLLSGPSGFVCWSRGFVELAGRGDPAEALRRFCASPGDRPHPLLLFPEEEATNGREGLLRFSSWPFSVQEAVQPLTLRVRRPLVSVNVAGASWVSELLWALFVPFTVYQVAAAHPQGARGGQRGAGGPRAAAGGRGAGPRRDSPHPGGQGRAPQTTAPRGSSGSSAAGPSHGRPRTGRAAGRAVPAGQRSPASRAAGGHQERPGPHRLRGHDHHQPAGETRGRRPVPARAPGPQGEISALHRDVRQVSLGPTRESAGAETGAVRARPQAFFGEARPEPPRDAVTAEGSAEPGPASPSPIKRRVFTDPRAWCGHSRGRRRPRPGTAIPGILRGARRRRGNPPASPWQPAITEPELAWHPVTRWGVGAPWRRRRTDGGTDGRTDGRRMSRPRSPGVSVSVSPYDGLPVSSRYTELLSARRALPVWAARASLLHQLARTPTGVVLVVGPPGTGKTTQIPQWCVEFVLGGGPEARRVVVSQPEPLAALSLALRAADEMDLALGHEVGYTVPLEDCARPDTLLRFCWDGLLLQEVASTPGPGSWGVLVLDEVQRRSVASDALQGLLRAAVRGPGLGPARLVVVTEPALAPKLRAFWGDPPTVRVPEGPGETPVPVYRDPAPRDPVEAACQAVRALHRAGGPGDVLLFLASEEEICRCCEILRGGEETAGDPISVLPLHPGLGPAAQAVYEEPAEGAARRVVVTHWLADWSFSFRATGHHVVDTGLELRSVYNPRIRAESQVLRPISRSQAEARRWRARGSPPGSCLRLYPESFLDQEAPLLPPPRVCEENLSRLVLLLKRKNIAQPGECHFLDRPAPEAFMQALEDLDYLAALDDDGDLSDLGVILSELPLPPELAKALLAGCEFDCVDEMLTLAAMLTEAPGFEAPPRCAEEAALRRALEHPDGDHSTLIRVYDAFVQGGEDESWCRARGLRWEALCQARAFRAELLALMRRVELPVSPPAFGSDRNREAVRKALVAGYFLKVARDTDGSGNYVLLTHKHVAQLSPSCCYRHRRPPPWVVYHTFSVSRGNCLSVVSAIQPHMLVELAPPYFLSNLPPSESRDLLDQLRETPPDPPARPPAPPRDPRPGPTEACALQ
ncbi:ATP-dependent RNA helicase DQX1-like [Tachyglossus aculeatus]|uniref:ATP-dependent RNA helicase DQX1-like n=1 Tax=Tachyglossus aculeatus TaxID=9261 RepID=UPI0018F514BB|nr:ATP-dependent RNA helicase DQX1-like [Tachyglossus aculeatus]